MKIAVIGASGRAGSLITKEALDRGHEVTAIVRDRRKLHENVAKILEKDLFDLTYEDLKGNDVVVDAFGTWTEETLHLHEESIRHLCGILANKPIRLIVVGGAGSLYVNPQRTMRLMDTPDFPDSYKPVARHMAAAFDTLRQRSDVKWTYISPSADFVPDGPRSGRYVMGWEELLVDNRGESKISYADYAIAVVDEAERGSHVCQRFTVISCY